MNPLSSQKFWLALVPAVNALVIVIGGYALPDKVKEVSDILAAVDGVIVVFIMGYATPGILAWIKNARNTSSAK